LDAKEDLVLVDVRESAEFEHGHIGGAHLVQRGIIEAAAVLQMMGFKKVLNLAGGIVRWAAEGRPQVREAEY